MDFSNVNGSSDDDESNNPNFFAESFHQNASNDQYSSQQQYNPYYSEEPVGDGMDYMPYFVNPERYHTYGDAVSFMRDVAKKLMFEVTIVSSKEFGREKYVKCSRGIYYKGKNRELKAKRKNTKTKAYNCPFQLKTVQKDTGEWLIVTEGIGMCGYHNHPLMVYNEGNPQHSALTKEAIDHIKEMSEAQAKPSSILASLNQKFPTLHPTMRQIYNVRARMRKKSFEDRNTVGQLLHLAKKGDYFYDLHADPDSNKVTHLFLAAPSGMNLFKTYHWYVGIDSTYKTNKYKYPFVEFVGVTPTNRNFLIAYAIMKDEKKESYRWALTALKTMMGDDIEPGVIVSDKEGGIIKPIEDVFPNTAHLLCTWHIRQDVEAQVYKFFGKNDYGQNIFKAWQRIMRAKTEERYNSRISNFNRDFGHQKKLIHYLQGTWLGSKHKFIPAWTKWSLHFGNVTNCRVESAHSSLKKWLSTSTGALDSVFVKVDKEIKGQEIEIRMTLEHSRNKQGMFSTRVPFQNLGCKVSQYCLDILNEELSRGIKLGDKVYDKCGCAFKTTHGLPCACELKQAYTEGIPVSIDRIHPFWRTLVIMNDSTNNTNGFEYPSEDHRLFDFLAEQVREEHPQTVRVVSLAIRDILRPEYANYVEPEIKDNAKGRPKGSTSVRREPSEWERVRKKLRIPINLSQKKKKSDASFTSETSTDKDAPIGVALEHFTHRAYIPYIIRPYVEAVVDVTGDGNCGFRAVASSVFGNEDSWRHVRQGIIAELKTKKQLYQRCYPGVLLSDAIKRLTWFNGGTCIEGHWMSTLDDLYPIATFFNVTIIYIGYGTDASSTGGCYTILPLYVSEGQQCPSQEICIASLPGHYIRLNLSKSCPLPPITITWYENHEESVQNWDSVTSIVDRRKLWDSKVRPRVQNSNPIEID